MKTAIRARRVCPTPIQLPLPPRPRPIPKPLPNPPLVNEQLFEAARSCGAAAAPAVNYSAKSWLVAVVWIGVWISVGQTAKWAWDRGSIVPSKAMIGYVVKPIQQATLGTPVASSAGAWQAQIAPVAPDVAPTRHEMLFAEPTHPVELSAVQTRSKAVSAYAVTTRSPVRDANGECVEAPCW